MRKFSLFAALCCFTFSVFAQYTVGDKTITYTDPARSNRSVGLQFRFPGTNTAVATGQFPFVIFAHGFSMDQAPYLPYADSLAKRGYIVGLLTTETGLSPSHANFAQDLIFMYSKLISESNTNSASIFYQKVLPKGFTERCIWWAFYGWRKYSAICSVWKSSAVQFYFFCRYNKSIFYYCSKIYDETVFVFCRK